MSTPSESLFRHRRLQATGPATGARFATALDRKMGNGSGLRTGPIVRFAARRKRRVHDVTDEHMQHAAHTASSPEQHLAMQQRPRVPVHMNRQPRALGKPLAQRNKRPTKPRMIHHDTGLRINPTPRRHPNPKRPALTPMRRIQRRKTANRRRDNHRRFSRLMRTAMPREHPPTQVEQGRGRPLHRNMHTRDKVLRYIDVDRNMRTPSPIRPNLPRQLPQQPKPRQLRTMPSHRRRRETSDPRDRATSDRPMVKHHTQHRPRASSTSPAVSNATVDPTVSSPRVARTGGGVGMAGHEEVSARAAAGRIGEESPAKMDAVHTRIIA